MKVDDFRQMYVAELQELRSVEDQLVHGLARMTDMARHTELKKALQDHLQETRSQRDRLDELLSRNGAEPREHVDSAMQALLAEGEKWIGMMQDPDLRDAGLIASAQRVEHYEIAVYGTLTTWAKQLGLEEDLQSLHVLLEEEKRADERLTDLAKRIINPDAERA